MPNPLPQPSVVALVATYRRSALLGRLLASLESAQVPLAVMVVDNADDLETEAIVREMKERMDVTRLLPGKNLGCGGGLEYGEKAALACYPKATHFWILDDDAVVAPHALERMLAAMEAHGAWAACPMIIDPQGQINWMPGVSDRKAFNVLKTRCKPAEYLASCGTTPHPFSWAAGISLLFTRQALEQVGPHRADFWIRGEDIEFSLRLTSRGLGIFVPEAEVAHLHPPLTASPQAMEMECNKERAMLRNHAYIAVHLPHGRRIFWKLPGNIFRFAVNFGPQRFGSGLRAVWQGAAGKLPAGVEPKVF